MRHSQPFRRQQQQQHPWAPRPAAHAGLQHYQRQRPRYGGYFNNNNNNNNNNARQFGQRPYFQFNRSRALQQQRGQRLKNNHNNTSQNRHQQQLHSQGSTASFSGGKTNHNNNSGSNASAAAAAAGAASSANKSATVMAAAAATAAAAHAAHAAPGGLGGHSHSHGLRYDMYGEDVMLLLLRDCGPGRRRVAALAAVALEHLPQAAATWAALRKALVELPPASLAPTAGGNHHNNSDGGAGARCRGLWCVLDALLKAATCVFAPLVAPRLGGLARQHMPWAEVDWSAPAPPWCEAMVLGWEPLLPPAVFAPLRQFVLRTRSEAQLSGALGGGGGGGLGGGAGAGAASDGRAEAAALMGEWRALRFWCEGELRQQQQRQIRAAAGRKRARDAAREGGAADDEDAALAALMGAHDGGDDHHYGGGGDSEDDEEEGGAYEPEYVAGATRRALPDLGVRLKRQRRDTRNRPRDEFE